FFLIWGDVVTAMRRWSAEGSAAAAAEVARAEAAQEQRPEIGGGAGGQYGGQPEGALAGLGLQGEPVQPPVGVDQYGRQGGQRGQQPQRKPPPARRGPINAAPQQPGQQRQRVERRSQADGQGQAGVRQRWHQRQVHQLGGHQHHDGDLDRGADV